jgi:hypothetical protein
MLTSSVYPRTDAVMKFEEVRGFRQLGLSLSDVSLITILPPRSPSCPYSRAYGWKLLAPVTTSHPLSGPTYLPVENLHSRRFFRMKKPGQRRMANQQCNTRLIQITTHQSAKSEGGASPIGPSSRSCPRIRTPVERKYTQMHISV